MIKADDAVAAGPLDTVPVTHGQARRPHACTPHTYFSAPAADNGTPPPPTTNPPHPPPTTPTKPTTTPSTHHTNTHHSPTNHPVRFLTPPTIIVRGGGQEANRVVARSEEHTAELPALRH